MTMPLGPLPASAPNERPGVPRASVVIATRDRRETLRTCLASLAAEEPGSIEVIVVDNGSPDGTAAMVAADFPGVRLIRSAENLGFAGAGNLGAREARGDQLLFLNDDTVWPGRVLPELLAWRECLPGAGIIGPRLRNPDGSIQTSVYRFPSPGRALLSILPGFSGYRGFHYDRELAVDFVSGACFLVSRELFLAVGGFDERFFMYGEETDLALRLRSMGQRSWFVPSGDIVHLGSANTRLDEALPGEFLRGHLRYCAAHLGGGGFRVYAAAKVVGHLARAAAAGAAGRRGRARRSLGQVRVFAGALVTGRGPFLAGQEGGSSDKVGGP